MNSLFDALNRRHPAEGIKHNSQDFDVLENTLVWLDSWEDNVLNHTIPEVEFLTKSTAEGLRITIKSVIDLSKHLLEECGFKYVLSSKMNQDRIEQFFGMARQATGPNDHPSCPTFVQVYKLLSVYSIIKPPKSGNCTILDLTQPKLTLKDIKDVFNKNDILPERQLKINHLKERLDTLITQDIEIDDVFQEDIFRDHDYYKSDTESCVLYYICGYVSRYINKHIKCSDCQKAVIGQTSF